MLSSNTNLVQEPSYVPTKAVPAPSTESAKGILIMAEKSYSLHHTPDCDKNHVTRVIFITAPPPPS